MMAGHLCDRCGRAITISAETLSAHPPPYYCLGEGCGGLVTPDRSLESRLDEITGRWMRECGWRWFYEWHRERERLTLRRVMYQRGEKVIMLQVLSELTLERCKLGFDDLLEEVRSLLDSEHIRQSQVARDG